MGPRPLHQRFAMAAGMVAIALCACLARAQDDDPRPILERAARALEAVESAQAAYTIESMTSGALARISPSGSGRVYWRRPNAEADDADAPEQDFALRVLGEYSRSAESETQRIDILATPDVMTTVDDERKRYIERDRTKPAPEMAALETLHVLMLIDDQPYAAALAKADLTLGENATVGGVACRVIVATFPDPPEGQERPSGEVDRETYYIGATDLLPRRIERVTESLLGNMGAATVLTDLRTDTPAPAARFEMPRPEGFRMDTNVPGRAQEAAARALPGSNQNTPREPTRPVVRRAPAPIFEAQTASGEAISLDDQIARERVTVLYFWGTWCLACEDYSPLLDRLASGFSGDAVDVYAMNLRDRDAGAARRAHDAELGSTTLVLNAGEIASDYRLSVYPAIVVIDRAGGLVTTEQPNRTETPEAIMQRVEAKVREALAQ